MQYVLVVDLGVPVGVSAVVWVDIRWVVIINNGDGPESSCEGCYIVRIPSGNWTLVQMRIIIGDSDSFFHLMLRDIRGIAHQMLFINMKNFRWRVQFVVQLD